MSRRLISAFVGAALLATALAAPTLAADSGSPAPGVDGSTHARATAWHNVASWGGGIDYACRLDQGNGTSIVQAYWNGRNYLNPSRPVRGGGGFAYVRSLSYEGIYDYTYSFGVSGSNGPIVTSTPMSNYGYVYFLAGSQVGIAVEAIMPVSAVGSCTSARVARVPANAIAHRVSSAGACVSKKEFRALKPGMTAGRIKTKTGAKGSKITSADYSISRQYVSCERSRPIVINFIKKDTKAPATLWTKYR